MGYFMRVDGGREYLAQVPGSSQSPLSDQETADLLNWMVKNVDTKDSEVTDRVLRAFGVDRRP